MGQQSLSTRPALNATLAVLAILGLTFDAAAAETGYYERKEEGWFWKEPIWVPEVSVAEPSAPEPELEEEDIESSDIQPGPTPLSPGWVRESLPKYLDRALAEPTPENVRAYFLLQRFAMDSAERFALAAQKVVMSDPALDENSRRPISSYGAAIFDQVAQQAAIEVASKIAQTTGLWYFYRSDCPFCKAQNPVLVRLAKRIGLTILPIALDATPMGDGLFPRFVPNRGHAEQLGIEQTPTLVLVRAGQFVLLSEGLVTEENFIHRMIAAAHEAGWISDAEFNETRPVRPSTLMVDHSAPVDELSLDPTRIAEILRLAPP